MKRMTIAVALAVLAALLVAIPAVGFAAVDDGTDRTPGQLNASAASDLANDTAPGERFSGVVGVGEAEFEGELHSRAFGHQVANASTEEAQADVVAQRLVILEQRLAELEQYNETLQEQREAGEIAPGKYRAELAQLEAQTRMIRSMTNQSSAYAAHMDRALLEERMVHHGMMHGNISALAERADRLGGPMAEESARGIAGPRMGHMHGEDGPVDMPGRQGGPHWPDDDNSSHWSDNDNMPGWSDDNDTSPRWSDDDDTPATSDDSTHRGGWNETDDRGPHRP